jgi:hypothetical protein
MTDELYINAVKPYLNPTIMLNANLGIESNQINVKFGTPEVGWKASTLGLVICSSPI